MPIYEYQCTECEYKLEALQKIADSPLVDCPECSQSTLKKLVSAASFRLKGEAGTKQISKQGIRNSWQIRIRSLKLIQMMGLAVRKKPSRPARKPQLKPLQLPKKRTNQLAPRIDIKRDQRFLYPSGAIIFIERNNRNSVCAVIIAAI